MARKILDDAVLEAPIPTGYIKNDLEIKTEYIGIGNQDDTVVGISVLFPLESTYRGQNNVLYRNYLESICLFSDSEGYLKARYQKGELTNLPTRTWFISPGIVGKRL